MSAAGLRAAIAAAGVSGLIWLVAAIFIAADRAAELRGCAHRADVCIMEGRP